MFELRIWPLIVIGVELLINLLAIAWLVVVVMDMREVLRTLHCRLFRFELIAKTSRADVLYFEEVSEVEPQTYRTVVAGGPEDPRVVAGADTRGPQAAWAEDRRHSLCQDGRAISLPCGPE